MDITTEFLAGRVLQIGGSTGQKKFYADSVNGQDTNPGTQTAPLRTLAALKAAVSGSGAILYLKRSSYWRENLDVSTLLKINIQAYGTGAAPIIDGTDVFTVWTKTTGRTNVYQASVTHDAIGTNRLTAYEDGTLLIRVADLPTCDSTPGSFVDAKGSDGSPLTMYIHPAAAGSPATNGHLYEITTRTYGLRGGTNCTVSGLQTQRVIDNNGSLDLVSQTGGNVSRCVGVWGTKHTIGMGSGSATDCVTLFADPPTSYEASSSSLVAYVPDGRGQTFAGVRCGAIGRYPAFNEWSDWITHGDTYPLDSFTLTQCWTVGLPFVGIGTQTGCYWKNVYGLSGSVALNQCLLNTSNNVSPLNGVTMTDCAVYTPSTGRTAEIFRVTGAASLSHCSMAGPNDYTPWFNNSSVGPLNVDHTVIQGGVYLLDVEAGMTYTGDYNVFGALNPYTGPVHLIYHGAAITTLAAWQAATGQDAHSVYLATADQVAGGANAFWLGWKNAASGTDLTTVGPAVGDFRVNPNAPVYSADGTAHIGTFQDGTPITQAGPQNHLDWNARASAVGAPVAWPVVPATLTDAQTYISSPTQWRS